MLISHQFLLTLNHFSDPSGNDPGLGLSVALILFRTEGNNFTAANLIPPMGAQGGVMAFLHQLAKEVVDHLYQRTAGAVITGNLFFTPGICAGQFVPYMTKDLDVSPTKAINGLLFISHHK